MSPPVPDPEGFARLLCEWCLEVEAGRQVLIITTPHADPLTRALHRELLGHDAWPILRVTPDWLRRDFYRYAEARQLDGSPPVEQAEMQAIDAYLRIDAPADIQALADVDPALIRRTARARAAILELRLSKRWCGTLWPTAALAEQAGMSEDDYASFVARALFLDRPDPVAAWRELSARQARLVERLAGAREVRIEAPGTDLRLRVDQRIWINSDGRRNMPSGEVFTSPLEDSATGTIRFTIPSSPGGIEVDDISLTFEHGQVVAARAGRGDEYLQATLATDAGARFLGELGIGTNTGIDRPTGSILLDEKMAGTIHLALGRSYPETGGRNSSAVHWDMICDLRGGGRLTIDGQMLNDNGALVV